MCNLILADDDRLVLDELQTALQGAGGGFRVIQKASNGAPVLQGRALPQADVVITDISMPRVDGLTLIEGIKSAYPDVEVVVLSNYDDFKLVKRAMQLGAYDYLLKHEMNADSIRQVVRMAMARRAQARGGRPDDPSGEYRDYCIQRDWVHLLLGQVRYTDVAARIEEHYGNCFIGCHCAVLYRGDGIGRLRRDLDFERVALAAQAEPKRLACAELNRDELALVLIFGEQNLHALSGGCYRFARETLNLLSDRAGTEVCCVIGPLAHSLDRLAEHYALLERHLADHFYLPPGVCIDVANSRPFSPDIQTPEMNALRREVVEAVNGMDIERLQRSFGAILTEIHERKFLPAAVRSYFAALDMSMRMTLEYTGVAPDILKAAPPLPDENSRLRDYEVWSGRVLEILDLHSRCCSEGRIHRAIQLIERTYHTELTLDDAARHCGFSRNYFSNLFSVTFGETFLRYLTRVRMEKSAAMLTHTDMSVNEIALSVGMEYHHFCRKFREAHRQTPTDYRRQRVVKPK